MVKKPQGFEVTDGESSLASHDLLQRYGYESVQNMTAEEVMLVQTALNQREQDTPWGWWCTPKKYAPGKAPSLLNVNVRSRILDFLPEDLRDPIQGLGSHTVLQTLFDQALLACMRYLLLCCYGPVSLRTHRDALDRTVLTQLSYIYLPSLAAASLSKALKRSTPESWSALSAENACFSRLTFGDVQHLSRSAGELRSYRGELTRMQMLRSKGWWIDAPSQADPTLPAVLSGPAPVPAKQPKTDPHQPLPNDYVSVMGQRSYWLIHHLYPNVERILRAFQAIWREASITDLSPGQVSYRCSAFLRQFQWTNATGAPIKRVPFPLKLSEHGRIAKATKEFVSNKGDGDVDLSAWPPTGLAQIFGLARAIQGAHYFISGLSMGSRHGESLTLPRYCIKEAQDGTPMANGRTYKLVLRHEGEERSWPLPQLAIQALQQQAVLANLLEKLSSTTSLKEPDSIPEGSHLWVQVGGANTDRALPVGSSGLTFLLQAYAEVLGMDSTPGGQKIRAHRLRKTLARLTALALADSPKILQQCFGHKSIEMTLYYILTDKALAAEIDTILDELRVMRAEKVVKDMVLAREGSQVVADGYGGKGAVKVRRVLEERMRAHTREGKTWTLVDIREIAEVLTIGGKHWNVVREGVLCTKVIGQSGPCNRHRGKPDPTHCQSDCDHRLEDNSIRAQVDASIEYALRCYDTEMAAGRDLAAAAWAGQIRANIQRFDDLSAKWIQVPAVRQLVETDIGAIV